MKSLTISSPTGVKLLLLEVNEDSADFDLQKFGYTKDNPRYNLQVYSESEGWTFPHDTIDHECKILGTVSKSGVDFDCKNLIDEESKYGWLNYLHPYSSNPAEAFCNSAEDSFLSWLSSIGVVFENKLPLPRMIDVWEEMEELNKNEWKKWDEENKKVWAKIVVIKID